MVENFFPPGAGYYSETAAVAAQNTFTDGVVVAPNSVFAVSVSGTFVGTVTLQRSWDAGVTWHDVDEWTAPTEKNVTSVGNCQWRIGIKTGEYTSGTANVRISQ